MIGTKQNFEIIKHHFKSEGKKIVIHACSQCEYPCGFYWVNEQMYFDSGCFCLVVKETPQLKNDDDLRDYIDNNPDFVKKIFEEEKIAVI